MKRHITLPIPVKDNLSQCFNYSRVESAQTRLARISASHKGIRDILPFMSVLNLHEDLTLHVCAA